MEGHLLNNWLVIVTNVEVISVKERLNSFSRLKEIGETGKLNAMFDSELYLSDLKDIIGTIGGT